MGTANRYILSLLALQLISPLQALAQSATPINLDLGSQSKTTSAGDLGVNGGVTINIGGKSMQVTGATLLTPAEKLAVQQVMGTGQQSLVLGSLGNATAGSFSIGSTFNQFASGLVIPKGVTAIQNAAQNANLMLFGNLTNAGSFYGVSTNPAITSLIINAQNITNLQGGLISTVLPTGGLPGITGAISNLNLTLNAVNNLVNSGTILSSGTLNLSAGNSITNALPVGASGARPLIQSYGDLTFNAAQISNIGTISSVAGNINFASPGLQALTVNNTGGTLKALMGSINLRDSLFTDKFDTTLLGGDVLSKELNVFSGEGWATVNVRKLTGVTSITAGGALLYAATDNLLVGNLNLSGDPLIANEAGNVELLSTMTDLVTNGADLAILASGNIVNKSATVIDTSSATGKGGNLTLVAGAKFAAPVGKVTTITGASATGGKIDLVSTLPITKITSSSTGASGDAGKIQLIAFAGSATGSGTITLPSTAPITADSSNGKAGDITIIAGGKQLIEVDTKNHLFVPVSISGETKTVGTNVTINGIGNISNLGSAGSGNVSIFGATPTVPSGGIVVTDGTLSADFTHLTPTSKNGRIFLNKIDSSGSLTISTGDSIVLKAPIVVAGNADVSTAANGGNIVVTANFSAGGNITMTANGTGTISTPNQNIANPAVGKYVFGAALTPDGKLAYAPNNTDNTVSVINTATNTVIGTISMTGEIQASTGPKGAVSSPDGQFIYVVGRSQTNPNQGVVVVINTTTQTVSTRYIYAPGNAGQANNFDPQLVAVAPNGNIVIFNDYQLTSNATVPNEVTILSSAGVPQTNSPITLTGGIGKPINLGGIAINPQGTLLYVANIRSNNVSVVDLTTNTLAATIALPATGTNFGPVALAFNPTGSRLYVGQSDANSQFSIGKVLVIDTVPTSATFNQNLNVSGSQTFSGGYLPQGIQVSPTGSQLLINPTYYEISVVYNPLTLQIVETTGIGVSLAPDGYGSNTFIGIVDNKGVRNVQQYIACPTHNGSAGTVAVIQTPTIMSGAGKSIALKSDSGQISVNYDTQGGTFSANTGSSIVCGNVDDGASFLGASSSGTATGTVFQIGSMNGITTTGAINAGGLLYLSANDGGITLNGNVGNTKLSNVTLEAGGTGSIVQNSGTIFGKSITLNATGTGSIVGGGANTSLDTATALLNLTAGKDVNISNTGALSVQSAGSGGFFQLTNNANVAFFSNLKAAGGVDISTTAANGKIEMSGINAGTKTISLNANGSGVITSIGTLIGNDKITLKSGTGSIGSSTQIIQTQTDELSLNTGGAGNVFINNKISGTPTLVAASTAGSTFQLSSDGDLTIDSLNAKTMTVSTTANNGDITFNQNSGLSTSKITLVANGSGDIGGAGTLTGATLSAKSTTGNINLTTAAAKLTAQTSAPGDVSIFSNVPTTLLGLSGDTVSVISPQKLIISGNIIAATSVNLQLTATDAKSSITQSAATFTVSGQTMALDAGLGFIGSKSMPIKSAVNNLSANAGGAVFLSDTVGDTTINAASSASSFNLTSTGSIFQSTGAGVTSIFAPTINLTSGSISDIGSGAEALCVAASKAAGPQTVALNFKAGGNVNLAADNSAAASAVSLNFTGKSSAAGASGINITTSGGINLASGATLTASNVAPATEIFLDANGAITQSAASGTTLLGNNIRLQGSDIGAATPLFISGTTGSKSLVNLTGVTAGKVNLAGNSSVKFANASTSTGTTSFKLTSTGDITLGAGASVHSPAVELVAKGGITQADASNVLTIHGNTISLTAGATGIGTASNNICVDAHAATSATLTASSTGRVFINALGTMATSGFKLAGASKGTLGFTLKSENGIEFQNGATLTAPITNLSTTALGAGITQLGTGNTILSKTVNLDGAGSIGTSGQTLNISSPTLTLNVTGGDDVFVNNAGGATTLTGKSTANGAGGFNLVSKGNLVIGAGADVFALNSILLKTGSSGNITQLDPTGTVTLDAFAITLDNGGTTGIGKAANRLTFTSTGPTTLNVKSNGSAFLQSNTTSGTVLSGANTAKKDFDLVGNNSGIDIASGATVTGNTSIALNSKAGTGINQLANATTLFSPKITLNSTVGGLGNVGQSIKFANLAGKTTAVSLGANAPVDVFLAGAGPVSLLSSATSQAFNLSSTGSIVVTAPLSAVTANLGSGGSITTSGTGSINGTTTSLSATGDIGTKSAGVVTGAQFLTASSSGTGVVNLKATRVAGVDFTGGSSIGLFNLAAEGPLTVSGAITTNAPTTSNLGNLTLTSKAGALNVNANLTANGGSIKVQSTDTTNGAINIAGGLNISTLVTSPVKGTNGTVSIFIGTSTSTQNPSPPGVPPANITVTPTGTGKAFFGVNPSSITASGAVSVQAKNQNVFFNSAARPITIGAGTTITADPPAPLPAVAVQSPATHQNEVMVAQQAVAIPETNSADSSPIAVLPQTASASSAIATDTMLRSGIQYDFPVAKIQSEGAKDIAVPHGATIYAPEHDMRLHTAYGDIKIGANAVVLVSVTEDGVAIYNMHDSHSGDVMVSAGNAKHSLNIGDHLMLSCHPGEYADVNPVPSITHADLKVSKLQNGTRLFRSKFSLASAITDYGPIATLKQSATARERRIADRLIKNAAILMQMRRPSAPYARMSSVRQALIHSDSKAVLAQQ